MRLAAPARVRLQPSRTIFAPTQTLGAVSDTLARAGFIAAEAEAAELLAAASGDEARLEHMVQRRLNGEPLAWITGTTTFCGIELHVDRGVYVPRPHSEVVALKAASLLGEAGLAADICTGSGAVAAVLQRDGARVVATDIDPLAVACARHNGVDARAGDLFTPLPGELRCRLDVVTAVVPYVPTDALQWLQRDTFTFESELAYHGGEDGAAVLRRVISDVPRWLHGGGWLVVELGGEQAALVAPDLERSGFHAIELLRDDDGDPRGLCARLGR